MMTTSVDDAGNKQVSTIMSERMTWESRLYSTTVVRKHKLYKAISINGWIFDLWVSYAMATR